MSPLSNDFLIRNLALARQLFLFASHLFSRGGLRDRVMCVIEFDLTVENILRLVIAHLTILSGWILMHSF